MAFRVAVFADREVGLYTVKYLLMNYPDHLTYVCVTESDEEVSGYLASIGFDEARLLRSDSLKDEKVKKMLQEEALDHIILAWWPYILKNDLISIPTKGVINFHPAMLPFNAGKDSNFWSIVEECPFGVTLMFIDEGIDSGDIIFQKEIAKTWEDTGETLYRKELDAMKELFAESYPLIVEGEYERKPNIREKGSFHYRKDMLEIINIDLEKEYNARFFLNLLRAKTFSGYNGCVFEDHGKKYEVKVEINEIND